jgi:hypothetical protein
MNRNLLHAEIGRLPPFFKTKSLGKARHIRAAYHLRKND